MVLFANNGGICNARTQSRQPQPATTSLKSEITDSNTGIITSSNGESQHTVNFMHEWCTINGDFFCSNTSLHESVLTMIESCFDLFWQTHLGQTNDYSETTRRTITFPHSCMAAPKPSFFHHRGSWRWRCSNVLWRTHTFRRWQKTHLSVPTWVRAVVVVAREVFIADFDDRYWIELGLDTNIWFRDDALKDEWNLNGGMLMSTSRNRVWRLKRERKYFGDVNDGLLRLEFMKDINVREGQFIVPCMTLFSLR